MKVNTKKIRVELALRNWNLIDLSRNSNIPYGTIISVMNETRGGSIKTIGKISRCLGVELTDLVEE